MTFNVALVSTIAATIFAGLLAGASLDQSIKQLPARRTLGAVAYSRYSRAADLAMGLPFYSVLGIGTLVLSLCAGLFALLSPTSAAPRVPIFFGTSLALLHTLVTAKAAPTNFRQKRVPEGDEKALASILDSFARWQALRCLLQTAQFGVFIWAVAVWRP
jgi:hypothetical protein